MENMTFPEVKREAPVGQQLLHENPFAALVMAIAQMTDLTGDQRRQMMERVLQAEQRLEAAEAIYE